MRLRHLIARARWFGFIGMLTAASVSAATITTIDFENVPVLAAGPQTYQDAGPAQTIDIAGVATITGGVVLGLASALPAGLPGVTGPNIYGTASDSIVVVGGFGLPSAITVSIPSDMTATAATLPIINGMPIAASYTVTVFNGPDLIDQATYSDLAPFSSITAMVTEAAMTSLTITPVDTTGWDFATDTITLTESATSGVTATPEPSTIGLALIGMALCGISAERRRKKLSRLSR